MTGKWVVDGAGRVRGVMGGHVGMMVAPLPISLPVSMAVLCVK